MLLSQPEWIQLCFVSIHLQSELTPSIGYTHPAFLSAKCFAITMTELLLLLLIVIVVD